MSADAPDDGWEADDARANYAHAIGEMRARAIRPLPAPKIAQLRAAMAAADWHAALRIASRFPVLGAHEKPIMRAWEAIARPAFCRQLGRDPDALIVAGIAALEERYGHG